jgi:CRISPR-associated protein Cas2
MYVLITYDVATSTEGGGRRLRQVAKVCLDYGQRVQNSVFECSIEPAQFVQFKERILKIIDPNEDSVRFYHLGNNWRNRIDHFGTKGSFDIEGPLIL